MKNNVKHSNEMIRNAKLFGQMSNPIRCCILSNLAENDEMCVSDFCSCIGASQPLISKYLRQLKDAGLLKSEQRGRFSFYSIKDERVKKILECLN